MGKGVAAVLLREGEALEAQRNFMGAFERYAQALQEDPSEPLHFAGVGRMLAKSDAPRQALPIFQAGLKLHGGSAELWMNFGLVLLALGDLDDALEAQTRALTLAPKSFEVLSNLSEVQRKLGRNDEALVSARKAARLSGGNAQVLYNLGTVELGLFQFTEAQKHLGSAIAAGWVSPDALDNFGAAAVAEGQHSLGETSYRKALALAPQRADIAWNLAQALLAQGRFAEGWLLFEERSKIWKASEELRGLRRWDGDDAEIRTKRLLVVGEQGLGDTLQMLRLIPVLVQRGATVLIACDERLTSLVTSSGLGCEVVSLAEGVARAELWCPIMSLGHLLGVGTRLPLCGDAYLSPDAACKGRMAERMGPSPRTKRIGITWQGSPTHPRDRLRSIPLAMLEPLFSLQPAAQWYSLQQGPGHEALAAREKHAPPIVDLGPHLHDLEHAAAALKNLDLFIGVDSSLVHLAGALGVEAWLLLPKANDWRWGTSGELTQWYTSVRMFRQREHHAWGGVVDEVGAALAEFQAR